MDNIIIATFNDEKSAIEATHKLRELDVQNDVTVFTKVLLRKNVDGSIEYLKDEDDLAGWMTVGGVVAGSTLGLIGGPVGVLVGALTGFTVGGFADLARYSFDEDFLDSVKNGLPTGTTTLIAQVTEPSDVYVNTAFAPYAAQIWRTNIYTERDKYVQMQIDMLDAEIDEAERELREAAAEEKAKFEAKLAVLKARREAKMAQIKTDFQEEIDEMKESLARFGQQLQDKIDDAKRRRIENKLARYQDKVAKYQARAEELNAQLEKTRHAGV
ncbi:MAG TPA: DUF1269 domain-containing protein [Pyrinomonadaceae bacterium]|nr:DUF1269 domain-containing protein [Pyrinomonadaceae bacterium]